MQDFNKDDTAVDWMFARAHNYPLLTAEDEQRIDCEKWQALEHLQQLFVTDEYCKRYLAQWANTLLHHPPTPDAFANKEHYYLLRREQVGLLKGGSQHAHLRTFEKSVAAGCDMAHARAALTALQLPAGIAAGLAEVLVDAQPPRGVAAALHYWHALWPVPPCTAQAAIDGSVRIALQRALQHYYAARDKLVNHNLRLVFAIAARTNHRGVPYRDLVQNGVIGLIRAAEKFEQRKGYRFSTYAFNWISQAVRRTVDDLDGIVRYPTGVSEQVSRMHRERMQHLSVTGSEPDTLTLAQRLNIEPQELERLRQVGNLSISLDSGPTGDSDSLSLRDTLADPSAAPAAEAAERESLNRCLMQSIKILAPLEQRIVIQRWGLNQSTPLTRAQIAEQLQVSTEWVRQLEGSALAKLRNDANVAGVYRDHRDTDR
jgi:RNA polymerase sigma factor (sigma-70 family)